MAPSSAKSKRGRGGGSGGGKRRSSVSSTPATSSPPSVSLRPLPEQYASTSYEPPLAETSTKRRRLETTPGSTGSGSNRPTPQSSRPDSVADRPTHSRSHRDPRQPSRSHHSRSQQSQPIQPLTQADPVEDNNHSSSDDDGEADEEENHEGGIQMELNALLTAVGRDTYLTRLSPHGDGIWFGPDDDRIVNKVVKIMQEKFEGPWYNTSVTPLEVQDRWFIEFAHRFNWDPVITHMVRDGFDDIVGRRLKGIVSYRKGRGKPNWISQKVWDQMEDYWKTEEAIKKSKRASAARNSPRGDLGPHKQTGGPKSHANIQRKMSKEKGRPVSLGEVFIKTHTKKDGTFVDGKAKKISETYNQNLQSALSQASMDPSFASDGASRTPQLTQAQQDEIFLKSTFTDGRGKPYGIGSLAEVHKQRKKSMLVGSSSALRDLEEQLKHANSKIEEQAAQHRSQMDRFFKYLKTKDPELPDWVLDEETLPPPSQNPVDPSEPSGGEDDSDDDSEESGSEDGDGPEAPHQVNNGDEETL